MTSYTVMTWLAPTVWPRAWVFHTSLGEHHGRYSVLLRRLTLLERVERAVWLAAFRIWGRVG